MVRRASILARTAIGCGLAAWIIRCDHGIYERADSYSNTISVHRSFRWVIVRRVSLWLHQIWIGVENVMAEKFILNPKKIPILNQQVNGWPLAWRIHWSKCYMPPNQTNINYRCTKAVCYRCGLLPVANGLCQPVKIICWTHGERRMEPLYSRYFIVSRVESHIWFLWIRLEINLALLIHLTD